MTKDAATPQETAAFYVVGMSNPNHDEGRRNPSGDRGVLRSWDE